MDSFVIFLMFMLFVGCWSHECYVCNEQDDNRGKCTETVIPCNYDQDYCLSEIKWGSTPYWEIGAPMQYYISKQCANKDQCESTIAKYMPHCDHIWWKDWRCAECCKGDRCNFFVTLGSSSVRASTALLFAAAASVAALRWWTW